jgi:hypothetical protein
MLKREKPTTSPSRFNYKGLRSLLESVTDTANKEKEEKEKEKKEVPGSGGGMAGPVEKIGERGYGFSNKKELEPLSADGALYAFGIPSSFYMTGLGMQGADYVASRAGELSHLLPGNIGTRLGKYAKGVGSFMPGAAQLALLPLAAGALPTALSVVDGAQDMAKKYISQNEPTDDSTDKYIQVFDRDDSTPMSLKAKTIKYGDKQITVSPDSLQYKLNDPYKIKPFVDYAKGINNPTKYKIRETLPAKF